LNQPLGDDLVQPLPLHLIDLGFQFINAAGKRLFHLFGGNLFALNFCDCRGRFHFSYFGSGGGFRPVFPGDEVIGDHKGQEDDRQRLPEAVRIENGQKQQHHHRV
jgi:hypothetical protein